MSTLRRIDFLDGKTSEELARELAAREPEGRDDAQDPPGVPESPRQPDLRPLVARTGGSAIEGIYGLVLALSVIAVEWYYGPLDAGRVGLSVLVTAVVFWLAHIYAYVIGSDMSQEQRVTRAQVAQSARENWSLIEVVIPLVLVLGLGAADVIPNTAAIVVATVLTALELASAGGYAAIKHGATARAAVASAAGGLTLGVVVVLLKALVFAH